MAVTAGFHESDGYVALYLYPGDQRDRVGADPPLAGFPAESTLWFEWDAAALALGQYDFLGVVVLDIGLLTESEIQQVRRLDLPRLDVPDLGLSDVSLEDVLRWTKQHVPGRATPAASV